MANLFTVLAALGAPGIHAELSSQYEKGALRYVDLKGAVADAVWAAAARIQSGKAEYPLERVQEVLRAGADRARPLARKKLADVRSRVGLVSL